MSKLLKQLTRRKHKKLQRYAARKKTTMFYQAVTRRQKPASYPLRSK